MLTVTAYHNDDSRFMPYEDGQLLVATTSHRLEAHAGRDTEAVAEWAFHAFNADLDGLEAGRDTGDGETTFLAACVYRLLGYRSLSTGDVVQVQAGQDSQWLACEPIGWRRIAEPSNLSGEPLKPACGWPGSLRRPPPPQCHTNGTSGRGVTPITRRFLRPRRRGTSPPVYRTGRYGTESAAGRSHSSSTWPPGRLTTTATGSARPDSSDARSAHPERCLPTIHTTHSARCPPRPCAVFRTRGPGRATRRDTTG
jgi:hypothetical protein